MTVAEGGKGPDIQNVLGVDRSGVSRARTLRWLVWGGLALLLAVLAFAAIRMAGDGKALRYRTQAVQRGDLTVTVSATGTLEPTNTVEVGIEVSGTIAAVEADYNDRVHVGQVLARLDTSKLRAQLLQTEAALESAKAKVLQAQASARQARSERDRLERILKIDAGFVSPQDVDVAQTTLERALADAAGTKAQVVQTQAILDASRTDLGKAVIRSPIEGVVLERNVEPGQTVAASFQAPVLFRLAEDLGQMELQVDVDEADVGQVQEGQAATFTVDAYPQRSFPARITQLRYGAETVEGVVSYKAILKVDNADLALRPGMTATALIVVRELRDVLLVPDAALRFTPAVGEGDDASSASSSASLVSKLFPRPPRSMQTSAPESNGRLREQRVWTLQAGTPVSIPISIGASDGVRSEVTGGSLQAGTEVVTDGLAED